MPTREEQALLDLLPQQRQATAPSVDRAPESLPELTPEMLLGGAAFREFQAAQQIQTGTPVTLDGVVLNQVREAQPGDPVVGIVHAGAPRVVDGQEVVSVITHEPSIHDLSGLFMDGDAEAQAQLSGGGHTVASEDAFNIEYDMDELGGGGTPNEAVRFQIGRESPPPSFFDRAPMSGPSDGQVVSRRGDDGTFRPVARPEPQRAPQRDFGGDRTQQRMDTLRRAGGLAGPAADNIRATLSRQEQVARATVPRPPEQVQVYRPTAWERIMGDD